MTKQQHPLRSEPGSAVGGPQESLGLRWSYVMFLLSGVGGESSEMLRDRQRQTERQTERQTGRQIERQTERQTDRQRKIIKLYW